MAKNNQAIYLPEVILYSSLEAKIAGMCSVAHTVKLSIAGNRLSPIGVSVYSTRGGISGYIFLYNSPSASRVLKVVVSIFCDMVPIAWLNWLNRSVPHSPKIEMINIDHLSPTLSSTFLTGQSVTKL